MGSVFYDRRFPFPNGGPPAQKLLVLLNEPREVSEPYIFVWGNSHRDKDLQPGISLGCYEDLQFFFIPPNPNDFFDENTWIYLYECFVAENFTYTVDDYRGTISNQTLGRLIKCLEAVGAISEQYVDFTKNSWGRKFK